MANSKTRLRFLAMERSLRATGCDLPLRVIPYNDSLFDLPTGSSWWRMPEITDWLAAEKTCPVMRKYQCLTERNYQFLDADICLLRNPEDVLSGQQGFITSCGHWHNPAQTLTTQLKAILSARSTIWQMNIFNTGQFACDEILYDTNALKEVAAQPANRITCIDFKFHEQPGINLLVALSRVKVTNLTLPPQCMESTWAGDYPGAYEHYWTDECRKPYLIHWAGTPMNISRPINEIFYQYLTRAERQEWDEEVRQRAKSQEKEHRSVRVFARRVKFAIQTFVTS